MIQKDVEKIKYFLNSTGPHQYHDDLVWSTPKKIQSSTGGDNYRDLLIGGVIYLYICIRLFRNSNISPYSNHHPLS